MKYRLNLPIEYDSRRYGYFYSEEVKQFPSLPITEAEIFALMVAQKAIAQYHGTPFQKPLETAFRKLTGQLSHDVRFSLGNTEDAVSFRPFAPDDPDLHAFEVLTRAIHEQKVVRFEYKKLGARSSQLRRVHPYHLACIDSHWYLFGYDVDREAMRTFVLTRLANPEATAKRFRMPKKFNADEYLRGSFTVFKGNDDFEVVVDFDSWATDLLRGRKWHASQDFMELPSGCSRLRLRLDSIEEMERWILSWGIHATVVRPQRLVDRLTETAKALAARYDTVAASPPRHEAGDAKGSHLLRMT